MDKTKSCCLCLTLDRGFELIIAIQVINAFLYLLEGITFNAIKSRAPIVTMYFIFVVMVIFIKSNERRDVYGSRMLLYYLFVVVNCVLIKVIVLFHVALEGADVSDIYCRDAINTE